VKRILNRGSGKPVSLKAQPTVFLAFIGFGLYCVIQTFYLNEQFGSLLVDLAHQLSFYLDLPVLWII